METQKKNISFIIPVFNSEKTIRGLAEKLIQLYGSSMNCELILVNDNSKDESERVCRSIVELDDRAVLINLSRNFGQHSALLTGIRHANGEIVVCMDDDLQNPPEEVQKLIHGLSKGEDVVYGNYGKHMESAGRRIGSRINNLMASVLIGKPKNLDITSFFAMKKFIADEIVKYQGPYPYLPGLIFRTTSSISAIDVEHRKRESGKSNYDLRKLISLWMNGFTNFSVIPLRFASIAGMCIAVLGFIYLAFIIVKKLLNPMVPMGWTSIMAVMLFLGGIQLLTIGLAGEYIGRMYLAANEKPQSVIRDIVRKVKEK